MAVLLTSGGLANILIKFRSKKEWEGLKIELATALEPMVEVACIRVPLYLREDAKQEVQMRMLSKYGNIATSYCNGEIQGDLVAFFKRSLENEAIDYARKNKRIDARLVRIDDVVMDLVVYPKTYERSKLIKKIRKALEDFYTVRYARGYSGRASRFAYVILSGKRPSLFTDNLVKFFNGNKDHAKQAYTTALVIIKRILETHQTEVECLLEE